MVAYIPQNYNEDDESEIITQGMEPSKTTQTNQTSGLLSGSRSAPSFAGTGFINFQDVVRANQNKSQGLANVIGEGVRSKINQAGADIKQAKDNFNQSMSQFNMPDTAAMKDQINQGNFSSVIGDYNTLAGGYTGASGLSQNDLDRAKQSKMKALNDLSALQTNEGRQTLARSALQNPTYTAGESQLDGALLSADRGVAERFEALRPHSQNLRDTFQSKVDLARQTADQKRQDWQTAHQNVSQTLGGAAQNFQNDLERRIEDANRQREAAYNQAVRELSRDPSRTFGDIGKNAYFGNQIVARNDLGVDMLPFLSADYQRATAADVASPEMRAQGEALSQLMGDPSYQITGERGSDIPFSFDGAAYNQAVKEAQTIADAREAERLSRESQRLTPAVVKRAVNASVPRILNDFIRSLGRKF